MIPGEGIVVEYTHPHAKYRKTHGRDDRLDLHQRDVPNDHLSDLPPVRHVAQIRLSAQTGCQTHIKITLQTLQRRCQDQQLRDILESGQDLKTNGKLGKLEIFIRSNFTQHRGHLDDLSRGDDDGRRIVINFYRSVRTIDEERKMLSLSEYSVLRTRLK